MDESGFGFSVIRVSLTYLLCLTERVNSHKCLITRGSITFSGRVLQLTLSALPPEHAALCIDVMG